MTGTLPCQTARSDAEDVELARDTVHAAKNSWGRTDVATRAVMLNKVAQVMEGNIDLLATAETWDNGRERGCHT